MSDFLAPKRLKPHHYGAKIFFGPVGDPSSTINDDANIPNHLEFLVVVFLQSIKNLFTFIKRECIIVRGQ